MGTAFYTGVSGMRGYQQKLDVVAHNIANVNTTGYKRHRASFSDLLYTKMNIHGNYDLTVTQQEQRTALGQANAEPAQDNAAGAAGAPDTTAVNAAALGAFDMVGHGTRVSSVDMFVDQSGLRATEYPLDFAILGEGFFAVDKAGSTEYTRNGSFEMQMSGKTAYLVTQDGGYVLDAKGKQIKVPLDDNGQPDPDAVSEKLGVYFFTNPYGLIPSDGSRLLESALSGTATAAKGRANEPEYEIKQRSIETSNVDLGDEMVEIIQAQRAFQLNSRVVQTADQLDEVINNLR